MASLDHHTVGVALDYPPPLTIGIDVGQIHDPTAISVVEQYGDEYSPDFFDTVTYGVRAIGRLPIGTGYVDIAGHVARIVRDQAAHDRKQGLMWHSWQGEPIQGATIRSVRVVVDATGVGRGLVDGLRHEINDPDIPVIACTLTGGDQLNTRRWQEWSCGKIKMVSRLQSLVEWHRIKMPDAEEAQAAVEELKGFEIRTTTTGAETGAFRTGTWDDMVTALGMGTLSPDMSVCRAAPRWAEGRGLDFAPRPYR